MVIFSYFFEAGVGIAVGLTLGFLPGALLLKWLFKKKQEPASMMEKKQYKAVLND